MATLLVPVAIKVTLVFAAAWVLSRAMTRHSAAARHLVWTTALIAALAVPLVQLTAPRLRVPVLAAERPAAASAISQAARSAELPVAAVPWPADGDAAHVSAPSGARVFDWPMLLIGVWIAGVAFALLRLAAGMLWAVWLVRRATPVTDARWLAARDQASAALGMATCVSLRRTPRTTIPVACGIVRPAVLLPPEADAWSDERRRVVLTHEMAHVRRRDCLTQAVAQLTRALYWCNPFAHLAVAKLRAEQERACDDLVLATGTRAPVYADHLLEIASTFRRGAFPLWATVGMARPSQLEGRLLAILDAGRNRCQPARRARAAAAVVALALVLTIGALQLTAAAVPAPADTPRWAPGPTVSSTPAAVPETSTSRDAEGTAHAARHSSRTAQIHVEASANDVSDVIDETVNKVLESLPNVDFDFDVDVDAAAQPGRDQGPSSEPPVSDETRRRAAAALIAALNDESAAVREAALASLAGLRDERAIPGLLKLLHDPDADLRERAVVALGRFSTKDATEGLVSALEDANADVRAEAARALGRIARGQRRDILPPRPPAPPKPGAAPATPRPQVSIDKKAIQDTIARALEEARQDVEDARQELEREMNRLR